MISTPLHLDGSRAREPASGNLGRPTETHFSKTAKAYALNPPQSDPAPACKTAQSGSVEGVRKMQNEACPKIESRKTMSCDGGVAALPRATGEMDRKLSRQRA